MTWAMAICRSEEAKEREVEKNLVMSPCHSARHTQFVDPCVPWNFYFGHDVNWSSELRFHDQVCKVANAKVVEN